MPPPHIWSRCFWSGRNFSLIERRPSVLECGILPLLRHALQFKSWQPPTPAYSCQPEKAGTRAHNMPRPVHIDTRLEYEPGRDLQAHRSGDSLYRVQRITSVVILREGNR